METFLLVIFWICFFLPVYNYGGYAIMVVVLNKCFPRKKQVFTIGFEPDVTLLVAAYNEENDIKDKIDNCFQLDYPREKLKIAFVTDGSTDGTAEIISKYPELLLYHKNIRQGKAMAINRVMPFVDTPIVVFCDANTELNSDAIKKLVRHYANDEVGGVSGEKKINPKHITSSAGKGEGLYWKYESYLKKIDSEFYSVVGAAGELFSIRTNLYTPVEPDTILDDFMISLRINKLGYRIIYEPEAYAMENPSANIAEESKRKVRIAAGGFQSIFRLMSLLNIFKFGRLSFLYISHRVLRWLVTPFALLVLFIATLALVYFYQSSFYLWFLLAQIVFYLLAFLGWVNSKLNMKIPIVNTFYYFLFMNINVYYGLLRYVKGDQTALWQKSERLSK